MPPRSRILPIHVALGVALALLAACGATERRAPVAVAAAAVEPEPTPERWIRVQKTERTLSLYEGPQLVKPYRVVLGKEPRRPKLYQGDHCTPEGEYHIVNKYVHPYWSRFMLIDYPTAMNLDVYGWSQENLLIPHLNGAEPGPGGAIGIHGTYDEDLNRRGINWTEGCVSLYNADIDELYDLVAIGTRVVIEH